MFTYFSFPEYFILLPLITVIFLLLLKKQDKVYFVSLVSSLLTLSAVIVSLFFNDSAYHWYNRSAFEWIKELGTNFIFVADGVSKTLCLLTAIVYPFVIFNTKTKSIPNIKNYFILLFLMQTGLMGVFLAYDGLVFYLFWELVLIPAYFLAIKWGSNKSLRSTFKFYIYTFVGSILMLVGLIYLYNQSEGSFRLESLIQTVVLTKEKQQFVFLCFFLAFAIKMPLVPFHTWQPETYKNAPIGVTIILSAVMVKMGVFATMRWLIPFIPDILQAYSFQLALYCILGMLYASFMAFKENDLRKFVAYISIAHIALMGAAIFARSEISYSGIVLQMFNHGINILGLWLIVDWLETNFKVENISDIRGLAKHFPFLAAFSLIIVLGNIAVPLTNGFPGEFMMLMGIFNQHTYLALLAGLTVILGAGYMLLTYGKLFFGMNEKLPQQEKSTFVNQSNYHVSLFIIVLLIIGLGIFPKCIVNIYTDTINQILLLKIFW